VRVRAGAGARPRPRESGWRQCPHIRPSAAPSLLPPPPNVGPRSRSWPFPGRRRPRRPPLGRARARRARRGGAAGREEKVRGEWGRRRRPGTCAARTREAARRAGAGARSTDPKPFRRPPPLDAGLPAGVAPADARRPPKKQKNEDLIKVGGWEGVGRAARLDGGLARALPTLPVPLPLQAVVGKWETMRRHDTPPEKKEALAREVLELVRVQGGGGGRAWRARSRDGPPPPPPAASPIRSRALSPSTPCRTRRPACCRRQSRRRAPTPAQPCSLRSRPTRCRSPSRRTATFC